MIVLVAAIEQERAAVLGSEIDTVGNRARLAGGIGKDHHRRFQPLGAVHRHHPDPRRLGHQIALDHDIGGPHCGNEPGQRWLFGGFVLERQIEKFGDHLVHFLAQPPVKLLEPALGVKHMGEKLVWPVEIEPLAQAGQPLMGRQGHRKRALGQPLEQRPSLPVMGEREQLVLADPKERRAQYRRERQIVGGREQHIGKAQKIVDGDMGGNRQPVGTRARDIALL